MSYELVSFHKQDSLDMELDLTCGICRGKTNIRVNSVDFGKWMPGGSLIQEALPYLSDGVRELLLTATCSSCFDDLFPLELFED